MAWKEFAVTNLFALLSACWAHLPSTETCNKIQTVILAPENPGTHPLIPNGLEINNISRGYNACEQTVPNAGVSISL